MPRKSTEDSERTFFRAVAARQRYLLRNPEFRKEFERVARLENIGQRNAEEMKVAKEWGLTWLFQRYVVEEKEGSFGIYCYPKRDIEDIESNEAVAGPLPIWPFPVGVRKIEEDRYVTLSVDLEHPLDVLLPLIERELRGVIRARPRRRKRLDKLEFHLQVFDLARSGETFPAIAKKLRRRLSTVKSAYLMAVWNIFGRGNVPRKRDRLLSRFDPTTHTQGCSDCQKAKTFEEMCFVARLWAGEDTKGQRELQGYNSIRGQGKTHQG